MRRRSLAVAGLVVAGLVSGHELLGHDQPPPAVDPGPVESPPIPTTAFQAQVLRVVDGDTFLARMAGRREPVRVRVIGVDTPETVKPDTPVACFGPQASAFS